MPTLGIDIGTQSLKAVVHDDDMRLLGAGSVAYQPTSPQPGWAEEDPQLWLDALRPAIGRALAAAEVAPEAIRALAVCGQLDGCVPAIAGGRAMAPAILWMDRRAAPLLGDMDAAMVRERCGLVLDATHMGGKIAWLSRHLDNRQHVAVWHQPVSFVVEALTGARVMSHSLASTTMLYDLHKRDWSDALAELFGTRRSELPALAAESAVAGELNAAGAELTGLPAGIRVAVGTGDDFSNLIGCGVTATGVAAVSLGTAEVVGTLHDKVVIDPQMLVETHRFPGGAVHLGNPGWLSGGAVRWAAGVLGVSDDAAFMALAAEAVPGCGGLVFIPALTGAMAPKWVAAARGSFVGLSRSHGRAEMARAVLEGNAFAMRDVLDRLAELGARIDRVRLAGGGARSALWAQMRADLMQLPVETLTASDASATGAAVLAAVAAGLYPDHAAAATALQLQAETMAPDAGKAAVYDDAYRRYRVVFAALEPAWR
jgi:xylulokinase